MEYNPRFLYEAPSKKKVVMSESSIGLKTQALEWLLDETLGQRYYVIF